MKTKTDQIRPEGDLDARLDPSLPTSFALPGHGRDEGSEAASEDQALQREERLQNSGDEAASSGTGMA